MSLMEDLAFRRMLDLYYESEKPLPCELSRVAKLIGMTDYQENVRNVLNEFWNETENGWVNSRAYIEIEKYQSKASTARANGRLGGRPKKPTETQSVNLANPEITESKANHKPITNNHKLINNTLLVITNGFDHWWNLYPSTRRKNKKGCFIKFKAKCKNFDSDQVEDFVNELSLDVTKRIKEITDVQFMPATETYLNQERWNDEK